MFSYKQILDDKFIQQIYNKIDKFEPNPWSTHGLSHIHRVVEYANQIYNVLNLPTKEKNECLIACALHDVGAILGKNGHNLRSFNFAKDYLSFTDLTEEQKNNIYSAILYHGESNENSTLISKILVLADKLDITKQRVLPYGNTVLGMRQMSNINNVILDKSDSEFLVNIFTANGFNLDEWQHYYFTKKVYNSIKVMANHVGLEPKVCYLTPNKSIYLTKNLAEENLLSK